MSGETCFLFENVYEIISEKECENFQKNLSGSYLQRREMKKRRQKEFLTNWECLNCKKSSQLFLMTDSQFCKMFSRLFCFEQVKARKSFSENLFMLWFNFVHTSFAHLPFCTLFVPQNFAQALFSISLGTAVIPRGNEMKKKRLCKILGGK